MPTRCLKPLESLLIGLVHHRREVAQISTTASIRSRFLGTHKPACLGEEVQHPCGRHFHVQRTTFGEDSRGADCLRCDGPSCCDRRSVLRPRWARYSRSAFSWSCFFPAPLGPRKGDQFALGGRKNSLPVLPRTDHRTCSVRPLRSSDDVLPSLCSCSFLGGKSRSRIDFKPLLRRPSDPGSEERQLFRRPPRNGTTGTSRGPAPNQSLSPKLFKSSGQGPASVSDICTRRWQHVEQDCGSNYPDRPARTAYRRTPSSISDEVGADRTPSSHVTRCEPRLRTTAEPAKTRRAFLSEEAYLRPSRSMITSAPGVKRRFSFLTTSDFSIVPAFARAINLATFLRRVRRRLISRTLSMPLGIRNSLWVGFGKSTDFDRRGSREGEPIFRSPE